jgi:hypothetical protein
MAWVGWLVDGDQLEPYWPEWTGQAREAEAILSAAADQCAAFAPDPGGTQDVQVPERFKLAQVMQARALYRAGLVRQDNQIGVDGQTVTVFPMDWQVKALLRPKTKPVLV